MTVKLKTNKLRSLDFILNIAQDLPELRRLQQHGLNLGRVGQPCYRQLRMIRKFYCRLMPSAPQEGRGSTCAEWQLHTSRRSL